MVKLIAVGCTAGCLG